MSQSRRGLAITDLLAIAAVLLLIAAVGVPTLERARELSKRMACAVNLKALGGAAEVYADANKGQWMTPPFSNRAAKAFDGLAYLCLGYNSDDLGCVGFERNRASLSETLQDPVAGSTAVTPSRAYWMLVRSGDISAKQFICPSSQSDVPDPAETVDPYYDFEQYSNISYGYLVPFGPLETRPRQGKDHRMIFAADKGPNYLSTIPPNPYNAGPNGEVLRVDHDPRLWRPYNSPNHGGLSIGEGQNALFADGRVEFHRIPAIGVDSDNIYTVMIDEWGILPSNRIHGEPPHLSAHLNPYPGKGAYGQGSNQFATTDSLIYP